MGNKVTIKKALNTALTDGSIFKELPIYGQGMTAQKMGIAYVLQHSGMKLTSAFLDNYIDSNGHITSEGITEVGAVITAIFKDAWDRKWLAITKEYNPIHNYDRDETTIIAHTGGVGYTDKDSGSVTNTINNGSAHTESVGSVKGINSTNMSEAEKTVTDVNAREDKNTAVTDMTKTHSMEQNTEDFTDSHIAGNIGTTKTQEMIEDEFLLRAKYNFYNKMFEDIDSYLALKVYGTKGEPVAMLTDFDFDVEQTSDGAVIHYNGSDIVIHNGSNGLTPVLDLNENGDLYVDYEQR